MQFQYSEMQQYYGLVNSTSAYVPLGHFTFFKRFGQIPWYVGSLDGQMPHQLALQKASNPLPSSDYSKLFPCDKLFIQM